VKILTAVLLIAITAASVAQNRHDPLNAREVEQMRDSAQDPKKRVELVLSFARERMLAIERLRTASKPGSNDQVTVASLLADLAGIIDELDDNLDMYNRHSEDLRNPLRHVLDAESEFQKKLAELGESATAQQKRIFSAALEDATDSIKTSSETARNMLADQIAKKGELKNKDKASRSPSSSSAHSGSGQQAPDATGMGGVGSRPPEQ
jgi:hypothetical protein